MKSSRKPTEDKALAWYVQSNGLRPQMSVHPTYYFKDKNGNELKVSLLEIMKDYAAHKEAEKLHKQGRA